MGILKVDLVPQFVAHCKTLQILKECRIRRDWGIWEITLPHISNPPKAARVNNCVLTP